MSHDYDYDYYYDILDSTIHRRRYGITATTSSVVGRRQRKRDASHVQR